MFRVLCIAFLLLTVAGCATRQSDVVSSHQGGRLSVASTEQTDPAGKKAPAMFQGMTLAQQADALTDELSCLEAGGTWRTVGRIQAMACVLPASDAGKTCSDSRQCQVACVATGRSRLSVGEVVGQCLDSTYQFGCRTYVKNGRAGPSLCID